MSQRHQADGTTRKVVLSLLVLTVAGGGNYYRNWQVEEASQTTRPYQKYAAADLVSLRDAYASELAGSRANFDSAKSKRSRPVGDVGSIAGNVEQFQKTTRASSAIRDAAAGVAEREGQIEDLDRELEMRSQFGEGFVRHLKRLIWI